MTQAALEPAIHSTSRICCVTNLAEYLAFSAQLPGWIRGPEAEALAIAAFALGGDPVIVQIGTFFGSSAVLLAGARKLRGSGKLHCVDPFDCSGDDFSAPVYEYYLKEAGGGSLRTRFEHNVQLAGLADWIELHHGRAEEVARSWRRPIDMLALGGDHSPAGARAAYDGWARFLRPGGVIAVHTSSPRAYEPTHDGNRRVAVEKIVPPAYTDIRLAVHTTFARRAVNGAPDDGLV
jgi:predicted O-methyltransferase YrrM